MSVQKSTFQKLDRPSGALVAGSVLILVGILSAVQNIARIELPFLLLLAAIFVAAGLISRRTGLVIPGSILAGLYLGNVLADNLVSGAGEQVHSSIILLGIAGGFALISLLSCYTEGLENFKRWPLFVALPLVVFAGLVLAGSPEMQFIEVLSYAGPVILIMLGGLLIFKKR